MKKWQTDGQRESGGQVIWRIYNTPEAQPVYSIEMNRQAGFLHKAEQRGDIFTYRQTRRQGVLYTAEWSRQVYLISAGAVSVREQSSNGYVLGWWREKTTVNFHLGTSSPGRRCFYSSMNEALRSLAWPYPFQQYTFTQDLKHSVISSHRTDKSQVNEGPMKGKTKPVPGLLSYAYLPPSI